MARPAKAKPAPKPAPKTAPETAPPVEAAVPPAGETLAPAIHFGSSDLAFDAQFSPFAVIVPLSQLVLSRLNVRQTERDADVASLAEDIAARGLKSSLNIIPAHFSTALVWPGEDDDFNFSGRFEVAGGGRRTQALRLLLDAGRLPADHPVLCTLEPRDEARETSLSENLHRVAMNPADEFAAFAQISADAARAGTADPVAYTAKRFGVSKRLVGERLRLASLAPEVLDALRVGSLSVKSAEAYAGTEDHELQRKVFKAQEKANYDKHNPRTVREALRGASLPLSDGRLVWIGIEAYRQAGGRTETEMFMGTDGEERATDVALLDRLCAEQAEPLLAALAKADGFASGLFALGGKVPKPPKGFALRGYEYGEVEPEVKAHRIGVYRIAWRGEGLALADQFKPKSEDADKPDTGYVSRTPEQRAAEERQQMIDVWAARLAIGPFAGTPLEDRAFWPPNTWNSVHWEFADEDAADEDEEAEPVSALVNIRIRVTAANIAAQRAAAETKVNEIEAEQAARLAELQAERDARQNEDQAKLEDDESEFDEDDLEDAEAGE